MTLAFAKDKSLGGLKEAIVAGRTAVWYEDKVIGRQEYLEALFDAAVRITDIAHGQRSVRFSLRNSSDLPVVLRRLGKTGPAELTLPPGATLRIRADIADPEDAAELKYVATNFLIGPKEGLPVNLVIAGETTIKIDVKL